MNAESQVLAGLEKMDLFFQQKRVGAKVDIFFARDQTGDDFSDLGMHQRLTAGNRDHGRAALVHGAEAFFRRQIFFQDVRGVLDFAASGAGEIAAEQGFKHQHQRILLATGELLPQDIARHGPHL
jgi:hypothetical protein